MSEGPGDSSWPNLDQSVADSTVRADSTHGRANAFGNFNGTFINGDYYKGSPQSVKNLYRKLANQNPAAAAHDFVTEPVRGTRVSALNMLDPARAAQILTATIPMTGLDQASAHCAAMDVMTAAGVLVALSPQMSGELLTRMPVKDSADRMQVFVAMDVAAVAAMCVALADRPTDASTDTDHPGAAASAVALLEALHAESAMRAVFAQMEPSAAAADILARATESRPRVVEELLGELRCERAAMLLEYLTTRHFEVSVSLLNALSAARVAELLNVLRPQKVAQLLVGVPNAVARRALTMMNPQRSAAALCELSEGHTADLLEQLPPPSALQIMVAHGNDAMVHVFGVIRPAAAHQLLSCAPSAIADALTSATPHITSAALRHGTNGDAPGELSGPVWFYAPVAALTSLPVIVRRLGHDRTRMGVSGAASEAWASLGWMLRAGAAATAAADLTPPAASRYRRHRTALAALLGAAVVAIVLLTLTRSGSSGSARPRAVANSGAVSPSAPLPSSSRATTPTAASSGAIDSVLPILSYERDWQEVCPSPTPLQSADSFVLRLSCDIGTGPTKFTLNVVQYRPDPGGDPFAGGRPKASKNFSMLNGGNARRWVTADGRRGTYLVYLNTEDNRPSVWLEAADQPVAVLLFGPIGGTIRSDLALLTSHGYTFQT